MVRLIKAAVHIIPARVDDHAVVVDARLPLVGLVQAQRHDVRAVIEHAVQRKGGDLAPVAAAKAAAPFRNESDPPIRQPARIEVVHRAVRKLHEAGAVGVAAEDVKGRARVPDTDRGIAVGVGEKNLPAVVRHVRREKAAVVQTLAAARPRSDGRFGKQIAGARLRGPRRLQRVEAVPLRGAVQRGMKPEILVAHVHAPIIFVGREGFARDKQNL